MIPRNVGPPCASASVNDGEENALYKLIQFSHIRCGGPGQCTDPLLRRSFAMSSRACVGDHQHRFVTGWKHVVAGMKIQAERRKPKLERAKRIPVFQDTTVWKTWRPPLPANGVAVDAACSKVGMVPELMYSYSLALVFAGLFVHAVQ